MPIPGDAHTYISTATTTQVYTGVCILKSVIVNSSAGAISIIDNTAGSTVNVGLIEDGVTGTFYYNCTMGNGIRIITAGAADVTVTYTT